MYVCVGWRVRRQGSLLCVCEREQGFHLFVWCGGVGGGQLFISVLKLYVSVMQLLYYAPTLRQDEG